MKKLLMTLSLALGAFVLHAQEDGSGLNDLRVVTNPEIQSGEMIIAQGYYAPSDPAAPEVTSYAWDLMPCDADGNPEGDPVFTQQMSGAPNGTDFAFTGSDTLSADRYYRVGLMTTDAAGNMNSASAVVFVTNTSSGCISGPTTFNAPPGTGIAGTGQTIFLSGVFFYTLTTSGNTSLVSNFLVMFNGFNIQPNTMFSMSGSSTPFDLSFFIQANQPMCSSETFTIKFFNISSQLVCTYTCTITSKPKTKQAMVMLNSGLYYKGDDDHLHRYFWNGSNWTYQAINPWGGWGNVAIDGWLTGDPNVDRVFFKGKDGGLYNIFLSNGSWLLGIVGNGLFDVKSDVHMAGQEIYYIANDNLIHRRFFANSQWNAALISPANGYQGVTAVGGMDASPSGGVWFRASNNGIMQLFMSGNTYFSQFMPTTVACGGDMIWDDGQSILYYRGTDNSIHNVSWDWINGWVFNAMTSQNGSVFVTNNLAHTPGENRVWFKGTDGRVYGIWKQSNGQWRIDWASGAGNNVAGDILSFASNIFYTTTSKQVGNYWFSGNPSWNINLLDPSAPANAIGCSSLYRIGRDEETSATLPEENGESFSVYPNPSNGAFRIALVNPSADAQVELFNMVGERVDAFSFTGAEYSYSPSDKLTSGIYLLRVNSGGMTSQQRIVIR